MTMRLAKEEMFLMLPSTLSSYSSSTPYQAAEEPARRTLAQRAGGVLRWLVEMPRRRAMLDELGSLSEHELADIGLSRADLGRVFDPAFVAQRAANRQYSDRF